MCSSWFLLLRKIFKIKPQKVQNKCFSFSLNLPLASRINPSHFRNINGLPVDGRVEYRIANTVLSNGVVPTYICEMFYFTLKV